MIWSTIVVGTDGSGTASRAVEHAASLALATGSALVVVTAYTERASASPSGADPAPGDIQWALTASGGAEEIARAAAAGVARQGVENVRVRTEPGDPTAVLLQVAEDVDAGLIVVGSKGMSSASRFVTGSVPNSLSHHADRDVLIVRTD